MIVERIRFHAKIPSGQSSKARRLTFAYLRDLYALDREVCLFRVFRRLWACEEDARPVLALLIALARGALLRVGVPIILAAEAGTRVMRQTMEQDYGKWSEGRFSATSLEAIAQRVNGTWTRAGYLTGKVRKTRTEPAPTPVTVAFALFLGYLEGRLAQRLYTSDWVRVLDIPRERLSRLVVFFPGDVEANNYRLLDARDGWNYMAHAITAD